MEPSAGVLIAVTVAVVAALLGYGLVDAWRYAFHDATRLPLIGMLRLHGLTPGEAQAMLGRQALALAARRCAFCASGPDCAGQVADSSPAPASCPNAGLFAELGQPRV
jgi:hypothetical protein